MSVKPGFKTSDSTYNGYTVVVNVCLVVELLLDFGVLRARPIVKFCQCLGITTRSLPTYSTPPGCRAVLLTRVSGIVMGFVSGDVYVCGDDLESLLRQIWRLSRVNLRNNHKTIQSGADGRLFMSLPTDILGQVQQLHELLPSD